MDDIHNKPPGQTQQWLDENFLREEHPSYSSLKLNTTINETRKVRFHFFLILFYENFSIATKNCLSFLITQLPFLQRLKPISSAYY